MKSTAIIVGRQVRLTHAIRNHGIWLTVLKFYMLLTDWVFDQKYGIETSGIESSNVHVRYQPVSAVLLRKLLAQIAPLIPIDTRVFVHLGSGKGRALIIGAEFGFLKLRGVENTHELCAISLDNCTSYKRATKSEAQFEIVECDTTAYEIKPDENCFFLFNPFGKIILGKVLENIRRSLENYPRRILIIYHGPRYDVPGFAKVAEMKLLGYEFIACRNELNVSQPFKLSVSHGRVSREARSPSVNDGPNALG
jgi:hypothetical protein